MKSTEQNNWDSEDRELEREYADVIPLIRKLRKVPRVPRRLDRKILAYARQRTKSELEENWLLGQGPWVVLVTLIVFAVVILVLLIY